LAEALGTNQGRHSGDGEGIAERMSDWQVIVGHTNGRWAAYLRCLLCGRNVCHQVTLPIPLLAEQRRIVAKVEQLMDLVDQLETQVAASRDTAQNLFDAIVAELAAAEELV
jgi:hypothetical protein